MHFSYKLIKLRNQSKNRRLISWIKDDESQKIIFHDDEIYFNSIILKGALTIDKLILFKINEKVKVQIIFSNFSKYLIWAICIGFYFFYIFFIPKIPFWNATKNILIGYSLIFLICFLILRWEVKNTLLTELKE